MRTDITRVALAVALVCAGFLIATSAMAAEPATAATPASDAVGAQHPAVLLQADVAALRRGIEAGRFIVAHPARLALEHRHANPEHPAVAQRLDALAGRIDVNRYLVQPPSPVRWTVQEAWVTAGDAVALNRAR